MRIAFDRDIVHLFFHRGEPSAEVRAVIELFDVVGDVCILPLIAGELETEGDQRERAWRTVGFQEVTPDEFLNGCAAGMARRYLDYYPDPRDCRLVAEAECAKLDALITLNESLIQGLAARAENVRIEKPSRALMRVESRS
jgi:hypothetical protein